MESRVKKNVEIVEIFQFRGIHGIKEFSSFLWKISTENRSFSREIGPSGPFSEKHGIRGNRGTAKNCQKGLKKGLILKKKNMEIVDKAPQFSKKHGIRGIRGNGI